MNHNITKLSEDILILDNLFSFAERERMYNFVKQSMYTLTGNDTSRLEHQGDFNIYSKYSEQDLNNFGILNNSILAQEIETRGLKEVLQTRVNLSTLNDKNHFHSDVLGGTTLLYYPNMEWKLEWGGYTLFADDNLQEIQHCVAYTPGRIILFKGKIPHCIAAPTNLAPTYRLSFAVHFNGETK
jgi:Rps23 Pro-64 3,4-dihydroxylase Tpa1-like proline 4-hydroxylase